MINLFIYKEKIHLQKIKKEKLLKKIMIILFKYKKTLKTLQNYMHVLLTKHYVLDFKFILCQNYI
jgi:hypothetical protein